MLVFDDDDLTIGTMMIDKISIKPLLQICALQLPFLIAFGLEIGK